MKASLASLSLLASMCLGSAAHAQETRTLKQVLDSIDFSTANVAVTASSRVGLEVPDGFKVVSVVGCTVKLRGEHTYPIGTVVSDLTIPLADLEPEGEVTVALVKSSSGDEDFRSWWANYTTKRLRRTVVLVGRAERRHIVRGRMLGFGFHDRAAAEKFAESFKPALQMCAGRGR